MRVDFAHVHLSGFFVKLMAYLVEAIFVVSLRISLVTKDQVTAPQAARL
jgi:hypothetical protein